MVEHNLFKNVSNWVSFLWRIQIQMFEYGLSDFGKYFVTKNLLTWTILILSML